MRLLIADSGLRRRDERRERLAEAKQAPSLRSRGRYSSSLMLHRFRLIYSGLALRQAQSEALMVSLSNHEGRTIQPETELLPQGAISSLR